MQLASDLRHGLPEEVVAGHGGYANLEEGEAEEEEEEQRRRREQQEEEEGQSWLPTTGTRRQRIFALFDNPNSCVLAKWLSVLVMVLILWSVVMFVSQTVAAIRASVPLSFWVWSEVVCVLCFSVEYVARVATVENRRQFVFEPLNAIDFLAIAPFYVDLVLRLGGHGSSVLRVLRLMRVFRVFKLSKYSAGMRLLGRTMGHSASLLGLLIVYLGIAMVVFASLIYFAEQGSEVEGENGDTVFMRPGEEFPSPYTSIPASFWWSIVTMTTVGYGDVVPVTPAGKLVASVAMLCGVLVLALPINVIGSNFVEAYARMQKLPLVSPRNGEAQSDKERADYYQQKCVDLVVVMYKMEEALDDAAKLLRELEADHNGRPPTALGKRQRVEEDVGL